MKQLFKSSIRLPVKNNQDLILESRVYYVASGFITLQSNRTAQDIPLVFFKRGDIINAQTLSSANLTLRAYGSASVLYISSSEFKQLLAESPSIYPKYVDYLQQQNEWLISQSETMGYKDVYRRLVARLLFLAEHYGKPKEDDVTVMLPMTHRQLANSVSSTRETVNKLIKQLEAHKLLVMKNKAIHIYSTKRLAAELSRTK